MAATESPKMAHVTVESTSPTSSTSSGSPVEEQDTPAKRAENKEALQYWGYLVQPNKCGTDKLNGLLTGIAHYISTNIEPQSDCGDLTPPQLAAFYRAVGGNYDILFVNTPHSSISFIYKSLGCLHSIQPGKEQDGYSVPTVPALKAKGFVTWQTIQLLLGPEEHVPFLQNAVKYFDIIDPATGEKFPKVLPKEAFPAEPNKEMVEWHDKVSERLRKEAESFQTVPTRKLSSPVNELSASESGEDETEAAKYFANPQYRNREGRPTIVTSYSRGTGAARGAKQALEARGRQVMNNVRHFWSPPAEPHANSHGRRRSLPDRHHPEDEDYEEITPTGLHPQHAVRPRSSRLRTRSPEVYTDSDSDDAVKVLKRPAVTKRTSRSRSRDRDREGERIRERIRERERERERVREKDVNSPSSKHNTPPLRHRRSHEPAKSPSEYFPPQFQDDEGRRHSHASHYATSEPGAGGFAPSTEPLFASRVAKIQTHSRRPSTSPHRVSEERLGNYSGKPTVRYSRASVPPIDERPAHARAKRSQERAEEYYPPRRREGGSRERRNRSYEREREVERRERERPRYVEGTGGRRYPSEAPWR